MLSQRHDVLVRRFRIVLPGGAEEREMQLELARIRALEQAPQLLVPARRSAIRLGEAFHLVWSLVDAQRIERAHQRRRIDGDLQRGRRGRIVADESHAPFGKGGRRVHDLERIPEVIRFRRSQRFPEALRMGTDEDGLSSRHDDQQAPRVGEGKPVLEVRRGSQRPVLIVRVGALERRP